MIILWFQVHRARDEANVPWLQDRVPPGHLFLPFYTCCVQTREYWMVDRGLGFVVIVWFGSYCRPSTPPPLLAVNCLSFSVSCMSPDHLLTGEEGKGCGGEAKSYGGEKAWSSINRSILWSRWIQWSLAFCISLRIFAPTASIVYHPSAVSRTAVSPSAVSLYCWIALLLFTTLLLCHVPIYHSLLCINLLLCQMLLCRSSDVVQPPDVSRTAVPPFSCITLLLCHVTALSPFFCVTLLLYHPSPVSRYCFITLLLCHVTALSPFFCVTLLLYHPSSVSRYCFITLLLCHALLYDPSAVYHPSAVSRYCFIALLLCLLLLLYQVLLYHLSAVYHSSAVSRTDVSPFWCVSPFCCVMLLLYRSSAVYHHSAELQAAVSQAAVSQAAVSQTAVSQAAVTQAAVSGRLLYQAGCCIICCCITGCCITATVWLCCCISCCSITGLYTSSSRRLMFWCATTQHKLWCRVYFCVHCFCVLYVSYLCVSMLRAWSRRKHSTTFSTSFSLSEVTNQEPGARNL